MYKVYYFFFFFLVELDELCRGCFGDGYFTRKFQSNPKFSQEIPLTQAGPQWYRNTASLKVLHG
jgi:hypothetical protein